MTSNCYEAGTFSYNLFMASSLGTLLLIAGLFFTIILGMALVSKLLSLPIFQGTPKWIEYFLMIVFAWVLPFSLLFLFDRVGEVENFQWQEVNGALYVNIKSQSCTKGACSNLLKIVNEEGDIIGKELQDYSALHGYYTKYETINGCQLIQRGETFSLVDLLSREVVIDLNEHFDKKYGVEQYKIQALYEKKAIELEKMDGSMEQIALETLIPSDYQPIVTEWRNVITERRYRSGIKKHFKGLFRAKPFSGIKFPLLLVLHRSTPFGEEGDFLLSAFSSEQAEKPMWTNKLDEILDGETDFKIFLSKSTKEAEFYVWVLRKKSSLSRLKIDQETGEVNCVQLIF